jgi:hypothetical protein
MIGINIRSFETDQGFTFVATSYDKFEVRTNRHGDGSLQITATVGKTDASRLLYTRDERYIIVSSNGVPIFRGVIHDITVNGYVVDIVAFGAWGALVNVPISGFWSHTLSQEWAELPPVHTSFANERFSVDNDGRLSICLSRYRTIQALLLGSSRLLIHNKTFEHRLSISQQEAPMYRLSPFRQ